MSATLAGLLLSLATLSAVAAQPFAAGALGTPAGDKASLIAAQTASEHDFKVALELELPKAATSIRLGRTSDGQQECVIGFDDKLTTELTFPPIASVGPIFAAFATRDPFEGFRVAIGAPGLTAEQIRATVRRCVKSGVLFDRYHASPI